MNEEQAFLAAILKRPCDDAAKLIYADWLDEQGDPRCEFLRLMVKVRQERIVTPEQRQRYQELSTELAELHREEAAASRLALACSPENPFWQRRIQELERQRVKLSQKICPRIPARLQELAATLDPDWLAIVSDPAIEGCGKGTGEGRRLRFGFLCDQSWADMKPTIFNKIRHCETCCQHVFFCDNLADAREHSHDGHCIAVDLGILRRPGDLQPRMMFMGRPSPWGLRQSYEEDVDPVSQARLDARKKIKKRPMRRP